MKVFSATGHPVHADFAARAAAFLLDFILLTMAAAGMADLGAPREAVPRASGSSLASSANTLTACSMRSTETEASSIESPNAFMACEASPAA